jgi:Alpha/beta hydrolase family
VTSVLSKTVSFKTVWLGLMLALVLCGQARAQPKESKMTQHANRTAYRTVNVGGLSIFYREAGPQDGPTLLLLHGFPSSSRMFEPLFARLSDRCRLIAPDYPGFGHSGWPTRSSSGSRRRGSPADGPAGLLSLHGDQCGDFRQQPITQRGHAAAAQIHELSVGLRHAAVRPNRLSTNAER